MFLTLYYTTLGRLKPTLVTNSNYLHLVCNKNLYISQLFLVFGNYNLQSFFVRLQTYI